ncbi:hypothetical protein [Streptomyces sp. NPDC003717]|uniref:hypothetical protein n=1 Tax=Streptomyces sp. NPDC003717 TaxID=3154276 RepID=UPI0033A9386A
MTEARFELAPYRQKKVHGRRGIVGDFGEVSYAVERRKGISKASGSHFEVRLHGAGMPAVTYTTIGPARPTLKNARLLVDGTPVELTFNSRGFRNSSRALHLTHEDRTYEYVVKRLGKEAVLTRPGVQVVLTRGTSTSGKGMSTYGTVAGDVDALDLALAIVFDGIDTLELTASGAVSETLNRLLNTPRSHETPVD